VIALEMFETVSSVLCLGAHPDDMEIGCGGTLLTLRRARPDVHIEVIVMTGDGERAVEAAAATKRFCGPGARVQTLGLRDGFLPYDGAETKEALRDAVAGLHPDIVFTHRPDDLHQDHRYVAELTGQLFRDHLVLGYEIPKYDGDLGRCNLYVPLAEDDAAIKIGTILEIFASQRAKHWMRAEVLEAPLRLRGVEARSASGLAEAFVATKLVAR
jgi:LmbE family N-acetylglucosaminyl deacetylase